MATDRIREYIAHLQEKPEPVRYRIAFGAAAVITGVVAFGWATALTTSGTLALKSPPVVADGQGLAEQLSEPVSAFSNLMGAAGAAFTASDSEAALKVIQTRMSSTLDNRTDTSSANAGAATSISF